MKSRWVLVTAAVALLAVGTLPSVAAPDGDHPSGTRTPTLVASFHDPGALGFTNSHPDCPDANRGGCAFAFDGTTVETGDLAGSTTYHGWLYPGDSLGHAFRWDVIETFTGKIAGCGKGSARWAGSGYGDMTTLDPSSQSARLWGTLTFVSGSGTGDLRGISGSLAAEARARAVPPAAQDGTFTGRVTCTPRR